MRGLLHNTDIYEVLRSIYYDGPKLSEYSSMCQIPMSLDELDDDFEVLLL